MEIVKQLEPQPFLRKKLLFPILLVLILVVILEIWSVNRLATVGTQISKLEKTKSSLILENQTLKNQISTLSSLNTAQDKVKNLGFEKIKNISYLKLNGLALKP